MFESRSALDYSREPLQRELRDALAIRIGNSNSKFELEIQTSNTSESTKRIHGYTFMNVGQDKQRDRKPPFEKWRR